MSLENEQQFSTTETDSGIVLVETTKTTITLPETSSENEASYNSSLDLFFPSCDCGQEPLGARVIVQLKRTPMKTKGGLVIVQETKETEKWNTQVAKLIKKGPLAFCNRTTAQPWPEGMWASEGDFVRVPRWGGDRWEVEIPGEEEPALFVVFNDHELITRVTGDPLKIKAFLL